MMADGVISLDDRPAIAAINRANTGLDGHEKKVKEVMDRTGKVYQMAGDQLVRVTDNSRNSLDRLLSSMQKQADLAGKSGVERMIAQRDQLINKWGQEQRAVEAITKAYDKMIAAEQGGGGSKWQGFADGVKNFIQNPLQAAGSAVGGLIEKMGPMGTVVSAGVATFTAFAAAGWEAAKSLASYGLEIKNVELRTGFTTKEVGQFGFAARMAGQDASIFERMMKGLSQASDEQSKEGEKARATLKGMGVDLRSATGDMKPTSQILLEISAGLGKLPEGVQRDAAAMDLFKRVGLEAIPVINGLNENIKRAKELGLGATDEDLKRWEKYHQNVTEAEALWERFVRRIKEPLAAVVTFFLRDEQGHQYTMEDLAKRGVNLGKYAPRTRAQDLAAAKAAGFGNPEAEQWERNINQSAMMSYLDKVDARQKGDAAVRAFQASQGLSGQLKKAEDALAAMAKPELGVSSAKDVGAYEAADRRVTSLKNQIEVAKQGVEQLKQFRTQAAEFEKKGDESELGAIGKIYYQRDLLIKQAEHLKGVEADVAGIRKSADEQASVVFKKDWAKFEEYAQAQQNEQSRKMIGMMGPSKEQLKEWAEGFAAQEQIDSINLQSRKDTINRQAGQAQKMVGFSGMTGMDGVRATYQIRIDLAKELASVEAERILKETNGAQQLVEGARAVKALDKEIAEAQEEAAMKQLEIQKQQMDMLKRETEGLWHTLLTKPQNFPKQLGSTIHEEVIKPVAEGMSAVTATVLKPIIYGQDGQGGLSAVFKGAFGGKQDPMKMATDMNTAVTAQNSAALATLTAVLAGAMGMASPAIAAPAGIGGISLPSISAPAVSGSTASTVAFGGGASSGSSFTDLTRGLNPVSMVFGGGTGTSAEMPTLNHAAGGGGFNPLQLILGGGRQQGGVAASGGGTAAGGIAGMLKNIKGTNWGGFNRAPSDWAQDPDGTYSQRGGGQITGVNGVAGAAMGAGGMMLAQQGLLGSSRGTWGGVAMGTAGGASIGYQQGGALGAAIGGAAGFMIGIGEKIAGVETPENEAKRLVKSLYFVNIDTAMAKQIVDLAKQKYAGHVSIAVRDPDVRKMLELYAQGTGQKMPLSATTPVGGSLAEQNGRLYQQASFVNGVATTFQSALPVMGNLGANNNYPTPGGPNTGPGMGPISLSLSVGGSDAASFLTGQVVTPTYVADASMAAQNASYGRVQASANTQVPGLITGT